ncbi:hypothetical protein AK830_g11 [Neonectria ditissima]|uniref:PD-(D/E)XK nuclease-like domain-containing protein n=1 Tax=Neonectria ditissima TaxID=78410 RepID=A0A0N8H956_9HYPO|nr:hypothetical protein AK830_g11 [Neonectria ditissima]
MLDSEKILAWVLDLPEDNSCPPLQPSTLTSAQSRKRKPATQHDHLTSPPASFSNMDSTPTRKRQKGPDLPPSLDEMDITPRPHTGRTRSIASISTSASRSSRSRSESPKKQMMSLRLNDKSLEFRQLDHTAPDAAVDLLSVLEEVGRGHDILPDEWRDRILQGRQMTEKEARSWRYSFKSSDTPDQLPGRIPQYSEVELVGEMAKECLNFGHDESGWNGEVHHRLLEAVFRDPGKRNGGILNFALCTTARPHRQYLPQFTSAKMVDLCIYADLSDDENWKEGLKALSWQTHTQSVNHTDFTPLQLRPIMLSIETKKPGIELDKAQLQMGVWHAAQWSFLRSAVSLALQSEPPSTESTPDSSSSDQTEHATQVNAILSRLGFIPGIIIQGHRWVFVLSTLEGQKTILWRERQFGSTQSILETYQIVAGLRELGAWTRDVYLPWFQKHVLTG